MYSSLLRPQRGVIISDNGFSPSYIKPDSSGPNFVRILTLHSLAGDGKVAQEMKVN